MHTTDILIRAGEIARSIVARAVSRGHANPGLREWAEEIARAAAMAEAREERHRRAWAHRRRRVA